MIFLLSNTRLLRFYLLIIGTIIQLMALGQTDSLRNQDSSLLRADTVDVKDTTIAADTVTNIMALPPPYIRFDTVLYKIHPYFNFDKPVRYVISKRQWEGKETFFYLSIGLLLFFAFIRNAFGRYLQDLFRLFFRTSIKQRQLKEQLMQSPLPSLLLNILFVISGSIFISLIFKHYDLGSNYDFWMLLLYAALALGVIYLVKFITLKICGWLFRLSEATDGYTFIVFTTNKVLGIVWLPFIILLSFTSGAANNWFLSLSLIITGALFIYRFYLSYATLPPGVKLHPFHFLLYLFAFEIIPLLLINKLLFTYLS
jgi:hypothetical protein